MFRIAVHFDLDLRLLLLPFAQTFIAPMDFGIVRFCIGHIPFPMTKCVQFQKEASVENFGAANIVIRSAFGMAHGILQWNNDKPMQCNLCLLERKSKR